MPLSDREQQILSDIEARLRAEDPKFAQTVSTTTVSSQARRKVKLAITGLVLGFVLLLLVIPVGRVAIGVVGFAIMLASVMYGGTQLKLLAGDDTGSLGGQLRGGFDRYRNGNSNGDTKT